MSSSRSKKLLKEKYFIRETEAHNIFVEYQTLALYFLWRCGSDWLRFMCGQCVRVLYALYLWYARIYARYKSWQLTTKVTMKRYTMCFYMKIFKMWQWLEKASFCHFSVVDYWIVYIWWRKTKTLATTLAGKKFDTL